MRRAAIALALALAAGPAPAPAEEDPAALARAAIAHIEDAAGALRTAQGERDRVGALTETVRAYEGGLAALRAGLRRTTARQAALDAALAARSEEVSRLLGVLAAIGQVPEPALLVHPAGPVDAARAAMLLSVAVPALQAEAEALRSELDELAALQAAQEDGRAALASGLRAAQEARTALSRAIAAREALPRRFAAEPGHMAELADAAGSLADLAALIAAQDLPPPGATPFEAARGTLPLPVAGQVRRRFGEADAAGVARPGIVVAAHAGALVTAPARATVRYTGPLLDDGNVMILEPDAATLLVLAGLGDLYAAAGEIVPAGAPLGLLRGPGRAEGPETGAEPATTLYIEVRRGEAPADPAEWFAIDRQK